MPQQRRRSRAAITGRMSNARTRWASVGTLELILYEGTSEGEKSNFGKHPHVRLSIQNSRQSVMLTLTSLRADELKVLREFVDEAIDRTMPLCEELDRFAQEEFEKGDNTFIRLYRPEPRVWEREKLPEPDPGFAPPLDPTGEHEDAYNEID